LAFWRHVLHVLVSGESLELSEGATAATSTSSGDDDATSPFPAASSAASAEASSGAAWARSACFDTLWHHVLGEHLFHYQPPYEYFEALPLVPFASRCEDGRRRMSGVCASLKVPHTPSTIREDAADGKTAAVALASAANAKCLATHGDMLGETLLVTTFAGSGLQEEDHSCCRKCRSTPRCSFWVRATDTRECWLKTGFVGYGSTSNRRGMFISEFHGIFLSDTDGSD
jgi:hypothetical protein